MLVSVSEAPKNTLNTVRLMNEADRVERKKTTVVAFREPCLCKAPHIRKILRGLWRNGIVSIKEGVRHVVFIRQCGKCGDPIVPMGTVK